MLKYIDKNRAGLIDAINYRHWMDKVSPLNRVMKECNVEKESMQTFFQICQATDTIPDKDSFVEAIQYCQNGKSMKEIESLLKEYYKKFHNMDYSSWSSATMVTTQKDDKFWK